MSDGFKNYCFVEIDGDRYQFVLPSYNDAMLLSELGEIYENLFIEPGAKDPYLCKRVGAATFSMLPSWRTQEAQSIYSFIHQNNDPNDKYTTVCSDTYRIRPMLVPVDAYGNPLQNIITDADGTFVYGGSLYNKNKTPIHVSGFGVDAISSEITIGDTADPNDPDYTIPWVTFQGMLVSRYALFVGTAKQVWEAGIR